MSPKTQLERLHHMASGLLARVQRRRQLDDFKLEPLTPKYDDQQHGSYARALQRALTAPAESNIRNIALTGGYGSGKSSILQETTRRHRRRVLQVSLSTLGDTNRTHRTSNQAAGDDGERADSPTNLIQKEIVKQILYQGKPGRMPGSRYRRLTKFLIWRNIAIALLAGLAISVTAYLTGATARLTPLAPWPLTPLQSSGLVWLGSAAAVFLFSALIHNRINIAKLSTGSATIELSSRAETFFDEYLDEIVYFFQVSGKRIVIIEDIDRFESADIFETLRSLNTILNSARQLGKRPNVRFIYAIKDSALDPTTPDLSTPSAPVADVAAEALERGNRTKFFDQVIPVVPFITHINARDLVSDIMKKVEPPVSERLTDIAAPFVADMRLVKEARNEYLVFAEVVLKGDGAGLHLSSDSLFAMMLYKVSHLTDFEGIRTGASILDKLYSYRNRLIAENLERTNAEGLALRAELRAMGKMERLSVQLGSDLARFARLIATKTYQSNGYRFTPSSTVTFSLDGNMYDLDDVKASAFWREYAARPGDVTATVISRNGPGVNVNLTIDEIATYVGATLPDPAWAENYRKLLEAQVQELDDKRRFLLHATMQELHSRPDLLMSFGGHQADFAEVASQVLPSALSQQLVKTGFIDGNFTLYTSKFYATRVSTRASNFILHVLDPGEADATAPLSPEDVETILQERGDSVLTDPAIYNVAVVDHLLSLTDGRADVLLDHLSSGGDNEKAFLQAYFTEGQLVDAISRRLAGIWTSIFSFALNELNVDDDVALEIIDNALAGVTAGKNYEVDENFRDIVEAQYTRMSSITTEGTTQDAAALAAVLAMASVTLADLRPLSASIMQAIVATSGYAVNRDNLSRALSEPATLSLDAIAHADSVVYRHVLAHLPAYLATLVEGDNTVDTEEDFVSTLVDVDTYASDSMPVVVQRAAASLRIQSIDATPRSAWTPLAKGIRFPTTVQNILAYLDASGRVDESLAGLLAGSEVVVFDPSDDETTRDRVALEVLNAQEALADASTRVRLAASVAASRPLTPSDIEPQAGPLVGLLLDSGLLADEPGSFGLLKDLGWPSKEDAIVNAPKFSDYMSSAEVTSEEIAPLLSSNRIDIKVKNALIKDWQEFAAEGDRQAATAVAEYAVANGWSMPVPSLRALAEEGVDGGLVIRLIEREPDDLALADVASILNALGGEYARMSHKGRQVPKLIWTPSTERLLERLKRLDVVASWTRDGSTVLVYMRRK